jgi:primase-polymerase (primpol)-like protein
MTGRHVEGTPLTIEPRQTELENLLQRYAPPPPPVRPPLPAQPVNLDDQALLAKALSSNGAFPRLFWGDTTGYPSHSEADLAFCCAAAFWVGRDPDRIDRWMRWSDMYRQKWERAGYREQTIAKAIASTTAVYTPRGS